jgi:hypothetical protein
MFNAIKYSQELEKAGFSREQAEASVKLLVDIMDQNLATKSDVKEVELSLRGEIREAVTLLRSESKDLQYKIITTLGSLMTALVGIAVAILKIR